MRPAECFIGGANSAPAYLQQAVLAARVNSNPPAEASAKHASGSESRPSVRACNLSRNYVL